MENDKTFYGNILTHNEDTVVLKKIISDVYTVDETKIFLSEEILKIKKSDLLLPVNPSKIICLAINFKGITNFSSDNPEPVVFLKASNSLCLDRSKISLPFNNVKSWGESELALVVKKKTKNIDQLTASKNILGYLLANDISSENVYGRDHHLARSKAADNYCPISYSINTNFTPTDQTIKFYHNDTLLRMASLSDMTLSVSEILSWLSSWMTLFPGDIILTGAPPRVIDRMYLNKGDKLTCICEGLNNLNNTIDE